MLYLNIPFHPFFSLLERGLGRFFCRGGSESEGLGHTRHKRAVTVTDMENEKRNRQKAVTTPENDLGV